MGPGYVANTTAGGREQPCGMLLLRWKLLWETNPNGWLAMCSSTEHRVPHSSGTVLAMIWSAKLLKILSSSGRDGSVATGLAGFGCSMAARMSSCGAYAVCSDGDVPGTLECPEPVARVLCFASFSPADMLAGIGDGRTAADAMAKVFLIRELAGALGYEGWGVTSWVDGDDAWIDKRDWPFEARRIMMSLRDFEAISSVVPALTAKPGKDRVSGRI